MRTVSSEKQTRIKFRETSERTENKQTWLQTHHGFVVERETLQLPQGVGGGGELLKDDEGLTPHLHRLHGHDVDDLTELREERVERALHLCKTTTTQTFRVSEKSNCSYITSCSFLRPLTFFFDFIVDVVDVYRVVWSDIHVGV